MTILKIMCASAVALSLSTTAIAAKPCVTRAEVETLTAYLLPTMVEGVAAKCRASLAPGAYLTTSAPSLAARLRSESSVTWAQARPVIERIGGDYIPAGLGGEFGARLVEATVAGALMEQLKAKDCPTADRLTQALAPLPATNTALLVGLLLELGLADADAGASAPFRICPAVAAQ